MSKIEIPFYSDRGFDGLPEFPQNLYKETYFLPNENYGDWAKRVCYANSNDKEHAERLIKYLNNYWFHPSTPISSNAGTLNNEGKVRGEQIACFTGTVPDTKIGIFLDYLKSCWLGSGGGGYGTDWSSVREIDSAVGEYGGKSSGTIPFIGVDNQLSVAISQGGIRRFSKADWKHISHPEIEEFIDVRLPTGSSSRRSPEVHHGVMIPDEFMKKMLNREPYDLISPKTGEVVKTVDAFDLYCKILTNRFGKGKGEPYIGYIDNINNNLPFEYVNEGISVTTSNICCEITLDTSNGKNGVCCLASLNLEYYDEYKHMLNQIVGDLQDMLHNVLLNFRKSILVMKDEADKLYEETGNPELYTKYSAFFGSLKGIEDAYDLGLGVMGYHSYLQSRSIPFESAIAKGLNIEIFKKLKESSDYHQDKICSEDESLICPMSKRNGTKKRNIHTMAIAPTMSISTLSNLTSSGIEPWYTNAFVKKTNTGSFFIKNKFLADVIEKASYDILEPNEEESIQDEARKEWMNNQWNSIKKNKGSVQHLNWMSDWDKDVFKTSREIDQSWIIEKAANRQQYIDQSQSLNIFFPAGSKAKKIYDVHVEAWKKGVKTLYYLRSTSPLKASQVDTDKKNINVDKTKVDNTIPDDLRDNDGAPPEDSCIGCT